jgi:hypothetical protein
MSKAFSLLTTLFIMLLVSMLMLLLSNISTTLFTQLTDSYKKEQASLLAISYSDFALWQIRQDGFQNNRCIERITLIPTHQQDYQIDIRLHYIGLDENISCPTASYQPHGYHLEPSVSIETTVSYLLASTLDTLAQKNKPITTQTPRIKFYLRSLKKL